MNKINKLFNKFKSNNLNNRKEELEVILKNIDAIYDMVEEKVKNNEKYITIHHNDVYHFYKEPDNYGGGDIYILLNELFGEKYVEVKPYSGGQATGPYPFAEITESFFKNYPIMKHYYTRLLEKLLRGEDND